MRRCGKYKNMGATENMMEIDALIDKLKALYKVEGHIGFDHPAYEEFHNDIQQFIYKNHFERTPEWEKISENLVYTSRQYIIPQEADIILKQLNLLKERVLLKQNEGFWSYLHPMIYNVSGTKFKQGFYADSVESAMKEVNSRIKRIYKRYHGEEKDGQDLMRRTFSPSDPLLTFEGLDTESGKNVQEGYMQIFAGAIQAIRNPKAHENMYISREDAIKKLILASLLMEKVDEAIHYTKLSED